MTQKYQICNWSEYNAGLKQRGILTFWISQEVIEGWKNQTLSGKRGASNDYSDIAIATFITVKAVYHQVGRQTQGLLESLFTLMVIDLPVPDHSAVSRRTASLSVTLTVIPKQGSVHLAPAFRS